MSRTYQRRGSLQKLLTFIETHVRINKAFPSTASMAAFIDKPPSAVLDDLMRLQAMGAIEVTGRTRAGRSWQSSGSW